MNNYNITNNGYNMNNNFNLLNYEKINKKSILNFYIKKDILIII